jgi:uncharacterized protein DUF998
MQAAEVLALASCRIADLHSEAQRSRHAIHLQSTSMSRKEHKMATIVSSRSQSFASTRSLLAAGTLAGPVFLTISLFEVLLRPGFDLTRHSLSLFTNGDLGWIHIATMLASGLLMLAGAFGLRQAINEGRARTWGPILIGIFGASFIAAGLMTPDPALGFPPGTAAGPPTAFSLHSIGHLISGSIGFLALIAACFVFARRFRATGEIGWARYSLVTGLVVLAAVVGISSGNLIPIVNLGFTTSGVIAWLWATAICARTWAGLRSGAS